MKKKMYRGVVVPMITPFGSDGSLDEAAVRRIIDHLLQGGVHGVFVLGTTGEAQSVPPQARKKLVETTCRHVGDRAVKYAGIADNCLANSIEQARLYFQAGIDVVVAHLPCYYPLAPDNMLRYYELLADSVEAPLMVYNITATTHMSIPIETVERLSAHPNIAGLKDSEKDEQRMVKAAAIFKERGDFSHLCGSAGMSVKALLAGSDGIVPSTGNFAPGLYRRLFDATAGESGAAEAQELQEKTDALSRIYQSGRILSQSLPALKVIMKELKLCGERVLPPLLESSDGEKKEIARQMRENGVFELAGCS